MPGSFLTVYDRCFDNVYLEEPNIYSIAISHSGSKLAYVLTGGVYIYDLAAKETTTLIEGNSFDVYYEDPSWNPGDQSLLVTRKTIKWLEHGFEVMSQEIMKLSLVDGTETNVQGEETLQVTGYYTHYSSEWGEGNTHLYVLKSNQGRPALRLMRVDLISPELEGATAGKNVAQYLEALVNGDVDTARRLYKGGTVPPTTSNPHPYGFAIGGSGTEASREYVDALQYVAYDGEPYYQVLTLRFYMQQFSIDEIVKGVELELYARNGAVHIGGQKLFTLADISGGSIGSLVYDQAIDRVYFTLYTNEHVSVRSFDVKTKQVGHVYTFDGQGINVTSLGLNAYGAGEEGFLAINYTRDQEHYALLYSLQWNQPVQTLGRANRVIWADAKLLCYTENSGELVRWEYDPMTGQSRIWPE